MGFLQLLTAGDEGGTGGHHVIDEEEVLSGDFVCVDQLERLSHILLS